MSSEKERFSLCSVTKVAPVGFSCVFFSFSFLRWRYNGKVFVREREKEGGSVHLVKVNKTRRGAYIPRNLDRVQMACVIFVEMHRSLAEVQRCVSRYLRV